MTDREMLELAAKAAGLAGKYYEYEDGFGRLWGFKPEGAKTGRDHWNPLADDGDAFRLAARLNFTVTTQPSFSHVSGLYTPDGFEINETSVPCVECGGDQYAATRRAITRAAAAIQEAKEGV